MNVPGTFTYTPALGTVLGVGSNQTLSVVFTPNDAADYTTASRAVTINVVPVNAVSPTIHWTNPANLRL